jgi:hypothetical protein
MCYFWQIFLHMVVVSLKYPCVCCLDVAIFGCDLNNHYFDSWNTLKHLILYS